MSCVPPFNVGDELIRDISATIGLYPRVPTIGNRIQLRYVRTLHLVAKFDRKRYPQQLDAMVTCSSPLVAT